MTSLLLFLFLLYKVSVGGIIFTQTEKKDRFVKTRAKLQMRKVPTPVTSRKKGTILIFVVT